MSKQVFKLTDDELKQIVAAINKRENPDLIWEGVCQRVGCVFDSIEAANTGDARDFLAESFRRPAPVPAVVNGDVRQGHTSASNAQADSLCPGRHLAQRGIPETPRGEDSAMGTRIHEALADSHNLSTLSLEERETFDACREIEKKLCIQYFGGDDVKLKVQRHERLWVRWADYQHSGEPDVVFRAGTKALILDYKVLAGDVAESSRNMQLRDLAVLVKVNSLLLEEIAVAIVQPLVTHKPELCVYGPADLERAATELKARVEASNDPKSLRVAGEVQCRFCKAKTQCAEFNRWQGTLIPLDNNLSARGLTAATSGLFEQSMTSWTPDQRALAASILPIATKRLEEIKAFLKAALTDDPQSIPGWSLKDGRKIETIVDAQQCFDRFASLGGHLKEFLECISVQKGELKKAVHIVAGVKGKALDAKMTELLDGICESKTAAPTLERREDV